MRKYCHATDPKYKAILTRVPMYNLVDFQKPYDSLDRHFFQNLTELGLDNNIVKLVKMTVTNLTFIFKFGEKLQKSFKIRIGVRQRNG